ncbi:LOW QUALITY PROTEIN: uncharacterized protein LOC131945116 [Physella acuta]|uniref:LOW QUALITY PROTEIN: uncharacterized protein LOC131945116 n=1 Tax=Physella acuta TaxID=109671 RepID=UPI0027DC02EE|nr:LOW QUALITY PROTEIN: uncharacterized protein LOC131945116 [Physella acuta]
MPEDRNSFIDLCIVKHEECSEDQFNGRRTIFTWRPGLVQSAKDRFWRTYSCVFHQKLNQCPIDGGWTEWTGWSVCKADCEDKGTQLRTRACENPKPAFGGNSCDGFKLQNRTCVGLCKTKSDGQLEAEEYITQIHDVFPDLRGICFDKHCIYDEVSKMIKDKNKVDRYWSSISCVKYGGACPVNGGWSPWGEWLECSVQCGNGERIRMRKCDNPSTKNGGIHCQGDWYEKTQCVARFCHPDPGLSDWSEYSPCSETCGKFGIKSSTRYCLEQKLCTVGNSEVSSVVRSVPCYGGECPAKGGWSKWLEWTDCSANCGLGRKVRRRECNSPYPNGGEDCMGPRLQSVTCDGSLCIQLPEGLEGADGDETLRKRRSLNDDMAGVPSFGLPRINMAMSHVRQTDSQTRESDFMYEMCKKSAAEGTVQIWKDCFQFSNSQKKRFDNRSKSIVQYKRSKRKTAIAQSPTDQKRLANQNSVNKNWPLVVYQDKSNTPFHRFSNEAMSYYLSRHRRQAEEPKDKNVRTTVHNFVCTSYRDAEDPFNFPFNPDMENLYIRWSPWTLCTASCGGGDETQEAAVQGHKVRVSRGVEGGWGAWQSWTPCSVTCGRGNSERYRACDSPLPAFGGSCAGFNSPVTDNAQTQSVQKAIGYGATGHCGQVVLKRVGAAQGAGLAASRRCLAGQNQSYVTLYLVQYLKRVENGLWAIWGGWSQCSEPCGIGNTVRDRTCTDPAPIYGGEPCDGQGSEVQTCYGGPCLDEDDYGIHLKGVGYLRYPEKGVPTGFFMTFLRFRPLKLTGTLFHHSKQCNKGLTECSMSIMLTMTKGILELTARISSQKDTIKMQYTDSVEKDKWHDVIVLVTENWVEMRVNEGHRIEMKFPPKKKHTFNFDGEFTVGNNRLISDGFNGKIAALRKNFKILLMFNMKSWAGYGVPSAIHKVKKIQLKTTVRHPDFNGIYYSHLFFRETHYLHVTVSFLITGTKGLLLFNGGRLAVSFVSVAILDGSLQFCMSCGSKSVCRKGYELKTGQWYLLQVVAKEGEGQIRLNEGDALQIMCQAGEKYQPRNSLYVGGAGSKDWGVIIELTKNNSLYFGVIDMMTVNGLLVTYKMATLLDFTGMVNSLGYSLSDYVTEVYRNDKSIASLQCGVPDKIKNVHKVRIVWLESMRRLVPSEGVEIIDVESSKQYVSKVNLHPAHTSEGVYACLLSQDGSLSVLHVFLVFRTQGRTKRDTEDIDENEDELNFVEVVTARSKYEMTEDEKASHAEWVVLIVLLVLILFCFCPTVCYCCTKDHPIWDPCRRTFNTWYCKISGRDCDDLVEDDYLMEESETEPEPDSDEDPVPKSKNNMKKKTPSPAKKKPKPQKKTVKVKEGKATPPPKAAVGKPEKKSALKAKEEDVSPTQDGRKGPRKLYVCKQVPYPCMPPWASPCMPPGMRPCMTPCMTPAMRPCMTPYMHPCMQPCMQPCMTPVARPYMTPCMTPCMQPVMRPCPTPCMTPCMSPAVRPCPTPCATPCVSPCATSMVNPCRSPCGSPCIQGYSPCIPQPCMPQPCMPQPCMPQPCSPQQYMPYPCRPQPCIPQPCTPRPCIPQPCRPQPCTPQPCIPQPCIPQPCRPQPCIPQPCIPQPCIPQPCTPRAYFPQSCRSQPCIPQPSPPHYFPQQYRPQPCRSQPCVPLSGSRPQSHSGSPPPRKSRQNQMNNPQASQINNPQSSRTRNSQASRSHSPQTGHINNPQASQINNLQSSRTYNSQTGQINNPQSSRIHNSQASRSHSPQTGQINNPQSSRIHNSQASRSHSPQTGQINNPQSSRIHNSQASRSHSPQTGQINNPQSSRIHNSQASRSHSPQTGQINNPQSSRIHNSQASRSHSPQTGHINSPQANRITNPQSSRNYNPQASQINNLQPSRTYNPQASRINNRQASQMNNPQVSHTNNPQGIQIYNPQTGLVYDHQTGQTYDPLTGQTYKTQGSQNFNPQTSQIFNPQTGLVYDPQTGQTYDPLTGQTYKTQGSQNFNPQTSQIFNPQTSQIYNPQTGLVDDPQTGQTYNPLTGQTYKTQGSQNFNPQTSQIFNPQTGLVYDPQTGQTYDPLTGQTYKTQGSQNFNPQTSQILNPQTSQIYNPQTGLVYDPQTDQTYDPLTGQTYKTQGSQNFNPQTSQIFNPQTGKVYDPQTGQTYNPQIGQIYDPQTGQTYYPQTGQIYDPQTGHTYSPQPGQTYNPQTGQIYDHHTSQMHNPRASQVLSSQASQMYNAYGTQTSNPYGTQTVNPFGTQTSSQFGIQTCNPNGTQTCIPYGTQTSNIQATQTNSLQGTQTNNPRGTQTRKPLTSSTGVNPGWSQSRSLSPGVTPRPPSSNFNFNTSSATPNVLSSVSARRQKNYDFVDQITVTIPPARTYKPKVERHKNMCNFSHFPCQPSYNPYALCAPYNTSGSIEAVDLLHNPYFMTPFVNQPRPAKNKSQNKDELNFSENNSTLGVKRGQKKKAKQIYLHTNTTLISTNLSEYSQSEETE